MWELRFDINPVAASRPRVTRAGHAYYGGPYKNFRKEMTEQIGERMDGFEPLSAPLCVDINCHINQPKKTKLWTPKADVDNYAKAVMDALNTFLWDDDTQVTDLRIRKGWTEHNGIPGWIDIQTDIDRENYEQDENGTWRYIRYRS